MKQFPLPASYWFVFILSGLLALTSCKGPNYTKPDPISGMSEEAFDKLLVGLGRNTKSSEGKKLFLTHCAHCHASQKEMKSPGFVTLGSSHPNIILSSLKTGKMSVQGAALSDEEKVAVSEWLTGRKVNSENAMPKSAFCEDKLDPLPVDATPLANGWGHNLASTGFQPAEQAGLSKESMKDFELKWAFAVPGGYMMRVTPAVIEDQVIFGTYSSEIMSIDLEKGCVHWTNKIGSMARGSVSVEKDSTGRWLAYVADFQANVYAFDLQTGEQVWQSNAAFHAHHAVTGSLVVYGDKVFVPLTSMEVVMSRNPLYECCTSSGAVVALNANDGKILWQHRAIEAAATARDKNKHGITNFAPSGSPVWSSPTIDAKRNLLYFGTGQNYTRPATTTSDAIIALDLDTGKRVWHYQATLKDAYSDACWAQDVANCPSPVGPDHDFGMAPILVERSDGKEILVAGQKSGVVHALDPDKQGEVLWKTRVGKGGALGGVHWGIASDGNRAYVTNADHPIALFSGDPETEAKPGVYALDLMDGKILWESRMPTNTCGDNKQCFHVNSAAPSAADGLVFAGALDGHIRAYDAEDGKVLWEFNTMGKHPIINGVEGNGGSIDCAAPVIAQGMLLVNSGYITHRATPGNLLMAFGEKEKP